MAGDASPGHANSVLPRELVVTLHVLVVEPPSPGRSLPELVDGPLDPEAAATLHGATITDAMVAAERSGGELLVNHPEDAEAELRTMAESALEDPATVRYEVQVGASFAAIAGNAATHLLDEEGVESVAVQRGTAPTVDRTALDGAAMQLRRNEVVIGPGTGGRDAYLGLSAPIDFEAAFEPPEIETLADRGVAAGHDVAFLAMHPVVEDEAGLAALVAAIRAQRRTGLPVPEHTAVAVEKLGLRVSVADGRRRVVSGE